MNTTSPSHFDYIVVGAGSAGCVVAARLSENPAARVLLLEGGGSDDRPEVRNPVLWPTLFKGELDWGYDTAPMAHCLGRIDHVPRGKMLGGCHSHNASVWVRGHPADYDHWAYEGNPGWRWADVEPVFRRIENWQGPADSRRGVGGPMYIAPPATPNPIATAFVESGPLVGLPKLADYNGASMEGTSYFNFTIKDGQRFTVVQAYLQPAMQRKNLTVVTLAETHRLLLEGTRCVGVEYHQGGALRTVRATKEVVLSAGVIGSPAILLRSGIGPAAELDRLAIKTAVDLPGVGRNLHDHVLSAGINYECKGELPAPRNNGAESTLWWKSDPQLIAPDVQPVIIEFPFATAPLAPRLPNNNCYAIAPSIVRPASRGSVRLATANPSVAPIIDVNFMACDADLRAMLFSIELCRAMGASAAFDDVRKREIMPGKLDRAAMIEFIRLSATTYFHPVGTCKMGPGADAVVDARLRVHGVEGLRVADASIMPTITSGNTNAPSVMIGERAAAFMTS